MATEDTGTVKVRLVKGLRGCQARHRLSVKALGLRKINDVRELKDSRKITLKPGESKTVRFTLRREDLRFIGKDLKPTVEAGSFDLWIAPSAEAEGASGTFELA